MKDRFEVLDVFRGLFSAFVVFFHMSAFANTPILNNRFIDNADLFVDFFFVLSGFVIAYSYRQMSSASEWKNFIVKRLKRLYPLHLLMLLLFVVMEAGKHVLHGYVQVNNLDNPNNNWLSFCASLLLINSVKLPGITDVSWNIPSWSISAEMISYVVFSLLLLAISRFAGVARRTALSISAVVVVLLAVMILYVLHGSLQMNYSFDAGFLRGLAGFFTGVVCLSLFTRFREGVKVLPRAVFHVAEAALIIAIVYFISQGQALKPYGILYEALFLLSVFCFAFEKGFVSQVLKQSRFLQNMGKYSYSIYMTHAMLLSVFNILFIRLLKLPESAYAYLFVLNYILIYKVSQWTFVHIEMRFARGKPAAPATRRQEVQEPVLSAAM